MITDLPTTVMVLGSGGREHALVRWIASSPRDVRIIAAPGNPGCAELATCVPVDVCDADAVIAIAHQHEIDLVVVGPEAPLAHGVADALREKGIAALGPSAAAARIETSKAFAKEVMRAARIPTATARAFDDVDAARAYVAGSCMPVVVKADGLAAGKGVTVARTSEQAIAAVDACMVDGAHGDAGSTVVIEDFMTGPELTVMALVDRRGVVRLLPPAQDHKQLLDGGRGPNTGGMGAMAPAPRADHDLLDGVRRFVIEPAVTELARRGTPFEGVLYAGLMLTPAGPRVVEFNARFGDPETQVVLPLIENDPIELLHAATAGALAREQISVSAGACVTVVAAAAGYPAAPRTGDIIDDEAPGGECSSWVIHAGTGTRDGMLVTAGGRVASATARAESVDAARELAYERLRSIAFRGMHYRADIAADASVPHARVH